MRAPIDRFLEKFAVADSGCWVWLAGRDSNGYGAFFVHGRNMVGAHRWAYEHFVGPVPADLELDHLCRNRGCVNPEHLEPVTTRENVLRGESPMGQKARQTKCVNGHDFDAANTYMERDRRKCRACRRDRARVRRALAAA